MPDQPGANHLAVLAAEVRRRVALLAQGEIDVMVAAHRPGLACAVAAAGRRARAAARAGAADVTTAFVGHRVEWLEVGDARLRQRHADRATADQHDPGEMAL